MSTYILDITSIDSGWSRGDPIPDVRVLDALAAKGITASYTAVDPVAGTVTVAADGDPAAALAGVTIGPTPAERAKAQAISDYQTARRGKQTAAQAVQAATTQAGFADAMKQYVAADLQFDAALTGILRQINQTLIGG